MTVVSFTPGEKVPYLTDPGVVILASTQLQPSQDFEGLDGFLMGMDPRFRSYLNGGATRDGYPAEDLLKFAGQMCYLSLGEEGTSWDDRQRYFDNIKEQGHGSVLEHASVTFLLYGVSRSLTHELVRHRAGFGFSQVSQRYVGPDHLRFVERPEYQSSGVLHAMFETRINRAYREYKQVTEALLKETDLGTSGTRATRRKEIQQVSRSVLPNEAEAPIVVTANLRAWRHFLEMRCSPYAEPEIRRAAFGIYVELEQYAPAIFSDYEIVRDERGVSHLKTRFEKV